MMKRSISLPVLLFVFPSLVNASTPVSGNERDISSVTLGTSSEANYSYTTALGYKAHSGQQGTALGSEANSLGLNSVSVGMDSQALQTNSIAVGANATSDGSSGITIGNKSKAGDHATVVGSFAEANSRASVAIGAQSVAKGNYSVSVGGLAKTNDKNATALGAFSLANQNATSLGYGSQASGENSVAVGFSSEANTKSSISMGLNAISGSIDETTLNERISSRNADSHEGIRRYKDKTDPSTLLPDRATAIGVNSVANGYQSTAIGPGTISSAENSVTTGTYSYVHKDADSGVAIGAQSEVTSKNGVALGAHSVSGSQAGQAGFLSNESEVKSQDKRWVSGYGSVSVGNEQHTRTIENVAAGSQETDAVNVAQLKRGMERSSQEAVATSNKYTDTQLEKYAQKTESSFKELDRKINHAEKRLNAGIAGVTALSSIPYSYSNTFSYGIGIGNYQNGKAIAAGAQYKINQKLNVRLNASWDSYNNTALGMGFASGW